MQQDNNIVKVEKDLDIFFVGDGEDDEYRNYRGLIAYSRGTKSI